MQFKWELASPWVGFLLRRFLPHDTYLISKKGLKVRVDGSLYGVAMMGSLPEWKRGSFSLLFDAGAPASR